MHLGRDFSISPCVHILLEHFVLASGSVHTERLSAFVSATKWVTLISVVLCGWWVRNRLLICTHALKIMIIDISVLNIAEIFKNPHSCLIV